MAIRSVRQRVGFVVAGAFALIFCATAPLRAQAAETRAAPPDTSAITPAMIDQGRSIFHGGGTCHSCHGDRLEGTPIAPTLREHKWRDAANGSFGEIHHVVTSGVGGTAMVAHPGNISDQQAMAVAAYIWAVNHRGAKP
ncbi:MAG TPA: cytochrome c [Gemmatimonadaceae bacterium]|nr:cytochrome c [Gemmatimonadaceae bacterium]